MMERSRLKTKTIMNQFKHNGELTLAKMAENYGMSENDFLETIKKIVGKENFTDLQKLNQKRLKAGKGKPVIMATEEDEHMKAKIREDLKEQKEQKQQIQQIQTATSTPEVESKKEEDNMGETHIENLQERLKVAETLISTISGQLEALDGLREATRVQISELQRQLESLKNEQEHQDSEFQEKKSELEKAKAEQVQVQEELDRLTKVILVCPRYWGKLSRNKNYVSSTSRGNDAEGVKVEKIPKSEWMSQPTLEKMLELGFDSLERYLEVHEFIQLVLHYEITGKPYKLMAPDNIVNMIKAEVGDDII